MKKNDYSDIINLPPHKSKFHAPMSNYNRAAQFSPFAALTGYEESIKDASESYTDMMIHAEIGRDINDI